MARQNVMNDKQAKDKQMKIDAKIIRKLMSQRSMVAKSINHGLVTAINDHGPITKTNYSSAQKRIIAYLKALIINIRKQIKEDINAQEQIEQDYNKKLLEYAKNNPIPQEWYDETPQDPPKQ